ncbi:Peroxisomal acyl-coenzyme A oxidase 1 [Phytophthora rubi]|uniref:Acyl-coenzyme A oxidase n=1 Tax=Phytophthora rubi TaxID=129364 RepID=A0A6A4FFB5_9STRA|nr:Peroxisomal acyl-coenzyme A oxidase 1 [Phytophthora rubi]KAE9032746.1 Peroxisomal acyl-coenzyme A oxidase 1 [Phytophthora rubi]KAE9340558.1 Peroxisomal acyl-coenzyme A oxidase 1 [Phytophthora rubi]
MAIELKDLAPLLLKTERANGDVDPRVLTNVLRGGQAANDRRKELLQVIERHPVLSDRDMMYRNHDERYNFGIKKAFHYIKLLQEGGYTDPVDQQILYSAMGEPTAIEVHRSMFVPTLENQGDDAQRAKWLPLAKSYKILGAYAQTELGHGSNVQGIETVATFDKATQEFVVDSPTLTSRKWWPGGLGKTANHAIVHARLFLDGKDVGVQAFLVQLRSLEDHQPLPGIEVGDIGPKVGFQPIDNGYCAFHKVRVPRENMMMRYAKVLPDGTFVKPKSDKLVYLTMVQIRAYLIRSLGQGMGMATTITTRYSATRVQGRKAPGAAKGEFQVLDYQNQQHVLFPYIAISYAGFFAGTGLIGMHDSALAIVKSGDPSFGAKLADLHAVCSGLKAWLANHVSDGIENCRRLCGGHGFTHSSNLGHLFAETVGACTYEGTFDVLVNQHGRYLLKALLSGNNLPDSPTAFLANAKAHANPSLRCKAQSPQDFANLELLLEAFRVRASRAVLTLAADMKTNKNDANACMVQLTRASTAHAELLLLEAFVNGLSSIPSGKERQAVTHLCELFGAWLITKTLGDFREHDYISSTQGAMARRQLVSLLPVIRKNCVLLTDAWDFTDFELNSTIGRYDGDVYRAMVRRAADEPLNKTQVPECYEQFLKPLLQSTL